MATQSFSDSLSQLEQASSYTYSNPEATSSSAETPHQKRHLIEDEDDQYLVDQILRDNRLQRHP
jgi:hypothetical protein